MTFVMVGLAAVSLGAGVAGKCLQIKKLKNISVKLKSINRE